MPPTGRNTSATSRRTAAGDVFFHLDPLWSDADIDFIGIDNYMPLSDWRDGFDHADAPDGWPAIYDRATCRPTSPAAKASTGSMPAPPTASAQIRTPITDGAAGKPWVFRYKDLRAWWSNPHFNRPGGVESGTPTAWVPQSKPIWFTELGCPAIDRGTNQPNVFFDPKSSESFTPHFSRGWRDDAIQRAYLEATYLWWGEGRTTRLVRLRRPDGACAGMRRLDLGRAALSVLPRTDRRLDRRPELAARALADRAAGRGVARRAGAPPLPARRAARDLIDVSGLWGAVEGYVITALESPRASITTLARHFGFDAIETEGVIRFVMRGRASSRHARPPTIWSPARGRRAWN
jgi:hypothetical protein